MESEESFFAIKPQSEASMALPSIGSDDEDSFVVLGTSIDDGDAPISEEVLAPIRSGKIHEMQNLIKMEISQINASNTIPDVPSVPEHLNTVTTSVANITLSPDSSLEEIQKQVEELIKENEKLKNIIAQNNISMKTQYDRILAWKEEVNEVMKSYKIKFVEAKNYIDKCKEENSKLANDVEKYKNIKELQDEEIINLKRKEKERETIGQVSNSAEQNMIQFDLEVANEKIKDLQRALREANLQKTELQAENEKLKEASTGVQQNIIEFDPEAANEKIKDLQTALAEANLQKTELKSENKKLAEASAVIPELEDRLQAQVKEIADVKALIATQETSHADYVKLLKKEIAKLQLLLEQESQRNRELSMASSTTMSSFESVKQSNILLTEQVDSLKSQLQSLHQTCDPHMQERYEQIRQQLMNSQITITALEQEVKNKVTEIEELRQLLQNGPKNDEMFALKQQLDVYKSDFEAERESRTMLKHEKDQLAEDIQNLHKRNKQLQQEVERLRGPSKGEGFTCPKCQFGFNSYQSLENHVHRCLDLEGFP